MNRKLYVSAFASLMLAACAGAAITSGPWDGAVDQPRWTAQVADTRPVGLGLPGGAMLAPDVTFAGGVQLIVPATSPLRSLSDLKLIGDTGFVSVSDKGDLVRGDLVLDDDGRLVALNQLRSRRLTLQDGQPISRKSDGDAEGLALLPDGDLLVSFEISHRIWNYGPLDHIRVPTPLPRPVWAFRDNGGMEALATRDGITWRVAGEDGGVWDCTTITCSAVRLPASPHTPDSRFRITGMDADPAGDGYFIVQRSFTPPMDARARVRRMDSRGHEGPVLVELKLPGTTDNFEGIAATRKEGATRLYILSDDNENPLQRTLMLAFDVAD